MWRGLCFAVSIVGLQKGNEWVCPTLVEMNPPQEVQEFPLGTGPTLEYIDKAGEVSSFVIVSNLWPAVPFSGPETRPSV